MDVEEEGGGLFGFGFPEIENVPFVGTVFEIFDGWRDCIFAWRLGRIFCGLGVRLGRGGGCGLGGSALGLGCGVLRLGAEG